MAAHVVAGFAVSTVVLTHLVSCVEFRLLTSSLPWSCGIEITSMSSPGNLGHPETQEHGG